MGGLKIPSEGGSGGKRGHSAMEHWAFTAEIKDAARIRRRAKDREAVKEGKEDADRPPRHPPAQGRSPKRR